MQKINFHNTKINNENLDKRLRRQPRQLHQKIVVDINKLLNRVKIEERNETKRKIIFFSLGILGLFFMGIFITLIK
jgi:predicted component of type VI protein secretion system